MKPGVKLNERSEAKLASLFRELAKVSDKPIAALLRDEGRLMAVELAKNAARGGNTPAVGKKHEQDVRNTIRGIYSYPQIWVKIVSKQAGFAKGEKWEKFIRSKDVARAQKMLEDIGLSTYKGKRVNVMLFDGGRLHKHTLQRGGKMNEFAIVLNHVALNKYIKQQQKRVGNIKSGWARAAEMLGNGVGNATRGIPAWAKGKARNHDTKGLGRVFGTKEKKVLMLSNMSKADRKLIVRPRAVRDRVIKMKIRLEKEVKTQLKKLNRKYK